ncbi:MAG: hypothetical protein FWF80_07820 [Defluviitaleaceae bacterium]|nr:hypothetical protein [Defluviitaleaceae bacterium]
MITNYASPILAGTGYNRYNQTPGSPVVRDNDINTDYRPAGMTPSPDAAMTAYSDNGDVLEVSGTSLSRFESFSDSSQIFDFDAIYAQLRANNASQNQINMFITARDGIRNIETLINNEDIFVAEQREHIARDSAEIAAILQIVQDIEDRIEEEYAVIESIDGETYEIGNQITTEEDRLEALAFALEDRLHAEIERLDDRIDARIELIDRRLERRLFRLARRQARHEARMERREQREMDRRARVAETIAGLEPGSPAYLRAVAREQRRQDRFDNRTQRIQERGEARFNERMDRLNAHEADRREQAEERISSLEAGSREYYDARTAENRIREQFYADVEAIQNRYEGFMIAAAARHYRWHDRQVGIIQGMENDRDRRMDINEERVEAQRTSPVLERLSARIDELEAMQAEVEERIEVLMSELFEAERDETGERRQEQLEDRIYEWESHIENSHSRRALFAQDLRGAQDNLNARMELWRDRGYIE